MLLEKLAPRECHSIASSYLIRSVRTIEEIRHARLMDLLGEFPTIQALADRIERSHAQVSQWKNRSVRKNKKGEVVGVSNIDSDSARWIESKTGKPVGWMDNEISATSVTIALPPKPPPPDFADNLDPSESEWALLQDMRQLPQQEREQVMRELHNRAELFRAYTAEVLAKVKAKQT